MDRRRNDEVRQEVIVTEIFNSDQRKRIDMVYG